MTAKDSCLLLASVGVFTRSVLHETHTSRVRFRTNDSQSPGPFKSRITEPPSHVILDDRAVHDILQSNIPRAQLSKRWSHDFSGQANVRHRRPHRGRPAYKDENATSEKDKYQSFRPSGKNTPLYFFLGESNFEPVFYHDLPEQPAQPAESSSDSDDDDVPKKPKQHNQYTAPELLVRNGAQSASLTKGKYRQRVNTFLRRSPTPPWVKDRKKLFGGVGIGRSGEDAMGNGSKFDFSFAAAPAPDLAGTVPSGESMWVDQDGENEVEESEHEMVMTSVFDKTPNDRPAAPRGGDEEEEANPEGTSTAPQKRRASTTLVSTRRKSPKQMGYIERLAAGLLREDAEAAAAAPVVLDHANDDGAAPSSDRDRIAQLEHDLEIATSALNDKNAEIDELRSVLVDINAQM